MTDKTTLNDLAPCPTKEEDATANAMTAHFAAFSLMHQTIAMNGAFDADRDKYMRSIGFAVSYYGLAHLLREVKGRAGIDAADAVARDLWLAWEDGSSLGEWCWEWLTSYGVDPEAVQKVADRLVAEDQSKAAESAPAEVQPGQVAVDASDLKRVVDALARASHHWDGYRPEDHDAMARLRSSIPSGGA